MIAVIIIIGAILVLQNPFAPPAVEFVSPEEGTGVGKKLPSFSLQSPEGNEVPLSDFKGQNLIINAWAAWCPFCIAEMPDLQAAADEHDDVTVLFVHRTKTEPFSVGQPFLEDFEAEGTPITDPILLDPDDSFYSTFFGLGMPVSLFVNKEGVIKFKKVGPMDVNEIRDNIEKYFRATSSGGAPPPSGDEIQTLADGTKFIIHPSKFLSGGPPKGGIGVPIGIPAIAEDQVKLISVAEANEWLPDEELGLGIVHKGEARFYPFRILVSHEIANDNIQGDPVLITYCPLCFTGISFIREIDGEAVQFGVSGKLINSELVMYDQKTSSYWPQTLGKAVVGPLTGTVLQKLPTDTVKWGNWKQAHPDTFVLSRDTGFFNNYNGFNPYGEDGNFLSIGLQFPLEHRDNRLPDQEVVYGIEVDGNFKAYTKADMEKLGTVEDTLGGKSVRVEFDQELESAKAFVEEEPIIVETLFWFAWAAFHPDTELYA